MSLLSECHESTKYIELKNNIRNSEHVYNVSCALGLVGNNEEIVKRYLNPTKTISGPLNYHFHNSKPFTNVELAKAVINKYFKNHPEEPIVIIFDKIEELHVFRKKLKESLSDDMNYEIYIINDEFHSENVMYGTRDNYGIILLTEIINFNGVQARTTIIFQNDEEKYDEQPFLRNLILRTQCFTIVIHRTDVIRKIPGLITDLDLDKYIY